MKKKIVVSEQAFQMIMEMMLMENEKSEGFRFSGLNAAKNQQPYAVEFDPNVSSYADTKIFTNNGNGKEFNIYYENLPKSGLKSINLYFIGNMNINKAVKHNVNVKGEPINVGNEKAANSLEYFKVRSSYYITRILSNMGISPDIFTSPQSSSNFNKEMLHLISRYYPNGNVEVMPSALVKKPNNLKINYTAAHQLGMSDNDINALQAKIDKIKKDENIRDFRRQIEALKVEIASMMTGKRGRPNKTIQNKKDEISYLNNQIRQNRSRGRDSTVDASGNVKGFQIKSLEDKDRRALDGLFVFNEKDYPSKSYNLNGIDYTSSQSKKFYGKVIVVFDDNLSSGATLDMACDALLQMGAARVIPITLGVIPLTAYNPSDRTELNTKRKRHE